jgi:cardiolipin synthase
MVVADRPGTRRASPLYQWLAEHARHSLEITDAYLVTPPRILYAFEAAARRGVDVRLLLPGRNNHPLAGAAARGNYQRLLDAGVGIWEWRGAMMHAKTAVVDGEVTLVGSSNLDPLSMRRNYELNVIVADIETGAAMREMFARDLTEATRVDAILWRRRPAWQRTAEAMASYFGPNL